MTGAPTLTLNDGATAIYDAAHSSATKLVFDYTVAPGQNVAALAAASVNLNGATIDDLAGNAAVLSLNGLTQKGPQIDTTAPTVVGAKGSPSSGDVVTGQTDTITLTLSEAAKVTGAPELVLSDGGLATYASGSGTNLLVFDYKVLAGQQSPTCNSSVRAMAQVRASTISRAIRCSCRAPWSTLASGSTIS